MSKIGQLISLINNNKILILILLVAVILRFVGDYPGYDTYHADEPAIYASALRMVKELTYDPGRYDYPATTMIINAIFYEFFFIPVRWAQYFISHFSYVASRHLKKEELSYIFDIYVLGQGGQNAIFWGRYVTSLFAVGNVLLIFALGKKLFTKEVGLIAAFLLTFNFKHVVNSHLVLPDIYNAFFLLLSILIALRLFEKQSIKNYIFAGVAAGISFSVKYQVYAFLPFVLIHLYVTFLNTKIPHKLKNKPYYFIEFGKRFMKKVLSPGIFIAVLLIPLVFILLNPFYLVHFEQAKAQNLLDVKRYRFGINQLNIYPLWYMYHFDYGPAELILFVVGLVLASFKSFKNILILSGPIVLFFYIFFYYSIGGFFVRNFITITPLLLIFAGYAIWQIYLSMKHIFPRLVSKLILITFLLTVVYIPAKNSFIASYSYTKPWDHKVMGDWLKMNLPPNAVVASVSTDILPYVPAIKRTDFEVTGNYSLAEHKENGANWALISSHWSPGHFYNWMIFGLDKVHDYWNKPMDMLRNNYYGIATEEFFRYQVFAATKPWQASDANMILAKISEWPNVEMIIIKIFSFDGSMNGWKVIAKDDPESPDYVFDAEIGHDENGAIRYITGNEPYSVTRAASMPIKIKPGYLYKVFGFIKVDRKLLVSEREGYLRVDFYGEDPKPEERGILTRVSARVYGTIDWVEKSITERAPDDAKYMVISFSNSRLSQPVMWLDDVKVEESTEPVDDITNKSPYNKRKIELDPFYPNSHGNL